MNQSNSIRYKKYGLILFVVLISVLSLIFELLYSTFVIHFDVWILFVMLFNISQIIAGSVTLFYGAKVIYALRRSPAVGRAENRQREKGMRLAVWLLAGSVFQLLMVLLTVTVGLILPKNGPEVFVPVYTLLLLSVAGNSWCSFCAIRTTSYSAQCMPMSATGGSSHTKSSNVSVMVERPDKEIIDFDHLTMDGSSVVEQ